MSDDAKRSYTRLTPKQTFEAMKLLEANGSVSGEIYAFNEGWSDERIAKEIGCPVQAIVARRKEVFGILARTGKEGSRNDERFSALEQSDRELRVKCYQLEQRVAALEKSVNVIIQAGTKDGGPITSDMVRRLKDHFEVKRT